MAARPRKDEVQPAPVTDLASLPVLLTVEEAAALLRISPKTAKDWARAGELPGAFKIGREWRVKRDELLAWMNGGGERSE